MRLPLLTLFLAAAAGAQQAPLLCPPAPAGRPCEAFHYHVAMFRHDPRGFAELVAVAPYATQAACERARDAAVAANTKVVATMRVKDQKYEADKFGPCHCDMTALTEAQRDQQLRTAEEIRLRVRQRLLDQKVAPDAEPMRALYSETPISPALAAPKLVPPPPTAPAEPTLSADDLKPSRTFDTTKPTVAALDLPLADITPAAAPPVATTTVATPSGTPASPPAGPAASPPPRPEPTVIEERVTPEPVPEPTAQHAEEEDTESAEAAAQRFIGYETERIQNVLKASSAITDEDVKTRIFEACMQRIQLLSNLRLLIEGSGSRSVLAAAARDAQTEPQRLALVSRLFSDSVKPHWAPGDASEVVFDVENAVAAAPESVLRDSTGRFSAEQKKRALYLVLAQTQPSEDQRLWLTTVVEGFLR
ncbi:MAG TPA: hypothetical protein VND45_13660 [Thermoanaerobaculia bacterium]|nr:hypothetical protein [Thermoanaerobaculia bacterium]